MIYILMDPGSMSEGARKRLNGILRSMATGYGSAFPASVENADGRLWVKEGSSAGTYQYRLGTGWVAL